MQKLRVGVIGLGIGKKHIRGYREHSHAAVVAIADTNPLTLNGVGDSLGVERRYESAEKMLDAEQLDVVSIATPNKFHCPLTLAALSAGCHVLCEKPMALSAEEGRQMVAAAKSAERRLMINFSYRFYRQSHVLKTQVEQGMLGNIYYARTIWHRRHGLPGFGGWFGQKALSGGGPLIDLGVHRLDLALWLMGYPQPVWVLAGTYDFLASQLAARADVRFDVEDFATALIRFQNGATMHVESSWAAHIAEHELMETRLLGTEGGLLQRNVGEGYDFETEFFLDQGGAQFDMKLHPQSPWESESPKTAMHHFIDAIVHDREHIATGAEGLIVMQLLDAIYESADSGQPVQIAN